MERIAITVEDLDTLVHLTGGLAAAVIGLKQFEHFLASLQRLIPFEQCILLHERPSPAGPKTHRHEYGLGIGTGEGHRLYAGVEMCSIGHCVENMYKTTTLENAFTWAPAGTGVLGVDAGAGVLAARLAGSQGIGGVAGDSDPDTPKTLMLLESLDQIFTARHLAILSAIMRPLHNNLRKSNDFAEDLPIFGNLTAQEAKVMRWVVEGKTSWEVGMILSISERTVKFHLANIYAKLKVANRIQAVSLVTRTNNAVYGEPEREIRDMHKNRPPAVVGAGRI